MSTSRVRASLSRPRAEVLEMLVWCAVALLAVAVHPQGERPPRLQNDSFQYLSVAQELRSAQRISTSLVHFDTERSHGVIPAPLTWFPPGYPAVIALLSSLGLGFEAAALYISVASYVLVTGMLWGLVRVLEPSLWAARAGVWCWIASTQALAVASAALSDAMFTLLGLAFLLFLLNTEGTGAGARNRAAWIGASLMAGLSYWVRHAGVFWALACVSVLAMQMAAGARHRPSRRRAAMVAALLLLLLAPLMVRNVLLIGDWRGGNNTPAQMVAPDLAAGTGRLVLHLALGDATISQLRIPLALIAGGLIWLCVAAVRAKPALSRPPAVAAAAWKALPTKQGIVLVAFLSYSLGVAAVSARSLIAYPPPTRYYVPVLPHVIALAACGVAFLIRRLPRGGYLRPVTEGIVGCLVAGYVAGNWISRAAFQPDALEKTTRALLSPDEAGRSLKQLLNAELKPGQVIAATNGQAAGYILKQPTLSLAGRPYTLQTWDEPALRRELARFGAAYLLVFRDAELDPVVLESQFLGALAEGHAPGWLRLAGLSREVCVYRVGSGET